MTSHHDDLTIRPITGPDELDLFNRFPHEFNEELAADLSDGHRQRQWLWIALGDGRLAARAGWWARPGDEHPAALDILDLDDSGRPETVDAHGRADLALMSPREAAAKHFHEELALYTSPRDWWRIADLPGGEPVGFVISAHNGYSPIIAYLGVLPAHRGHGYIADILAEGTRVLAAQDVPFIKASTDLGNVPMAAAFHRAGWVTTGHQIDMTWDAPAAPPG